MNSKPKKDISKSFNLTIEFDNDAALEHFAVWLSEQGEQDYWLWMKCRETEEEGNITAISFDYQKETTIKATCGRLSRGE